MNETTEEEKRDTSEIGKQEILASAEAVRPEVSHEAVRHFLKERGLPDTDENRKSFEAHVQSPEYKNSVRFEAARSFESYLKYNPLEVRIPNSMGGTNPASPVVRLFTEKVLRERAYQTPPEKMTRDLDIAREVLSGRAEVLRATPDLLKKMKLEDARQAALRAAMDWARRMEPVPLDEDPIRLSLLMAEAGFALRAEQKESTPELITEKVRELLKQRLDTLSFWRGYLQRPEEVDGPRNERGSLAFDAALKRFGFEPDGKFGYEDSRDVREKRAGGDIENFIEGTQSVKRFEAERLKKEEEEKQEVQKLIRQREEAEAREQKNKTARDAAFEALRNQPTEFDLRGLEAELRHLEQNSTLLAEEIEEKKKKLRGTGPLAWIGALVRSVANPRLKEEIAREAENLRVVSEAIRAKTAEVEDIREKLGKK